MPGREGSQEAAPEFPWRDRATRSDLPTLAKTYASADVAALAVHIMINTALTARPTTSTAASRSSLERERETVAIVRSDIAPGGTSPDCELLAACQAGNWSHFHGWDRRSGKAPVAL